ncbi:MAG: MoaD/ThiS family protein [Candidatus Latescibacterota bacterium]
MSVTVHIPSVLRPYVDNKDIVEIDAKTVEELLDELAGRYRHLQQLLSDEGGLRGFVNIYVNDKDIRDLDHYRTVLCGGDVVTLMPAIAGG